MMDWSAHLMHLGRRVMNQTDDPRIGSSRDNSTGGTVSRLTSPDTNSASLSSLAFTFIPVLIHSAICFILFFTCRRKCRRVYAARTIPSLRAPAPPSPELPGGWFDWIKPFFAIKDDYILNNCSLDGFFFLRFLRVLSIICLAGGCFAWPILLPVNGTGGNGLEQLDLLTIGNIRLADRYYSHVLVAWCFFGFVLFMVCRECIYYINLRQAYLLSPNYSKRLSSRTVLFTCIPKPYVDEARLRKLFGDSVKNVWIARDTSALRALVEDRDETADRLQKAEVKLIRLANAAREQCLRRQSVPPGPVDLNAPGPVASAPTPPADPSQHDAEKGQAEAAIQFAEPQLPASESPSSENLEESEYRHPYGLDPSLPDVRGSVAAQWIPAASRPYHRPLRNFGRRVDTIRWTRARLKVLNRDIWKLRRSHRRGDGAPLNAAFVEFDSQASAQAAFQILAHHQPLHMSPRYIGPQPDEVIWGALRIRWWEHIMRRFFIMGVIAAAVIFWSVPAAFVGGITNVQSLSSNVFFLAWIEKLPGPILGIIQGLLPALALSWLMAAVPWMLRGCARVAGVPSHALVELFVQHAYFAFQVVQVFLVTTLTSAASAAFSSVLQDPLSVKDLLSQNLPKASNFYLSYILVQCLSAGSAKLLNFGDLIRHGVLGKVVTDPRRRFYRWRRLARIHWGSEYPRFTNLGVIAISYSCIAPLILVFAGLGMFFIGYIYRYNLIFVYDSSLDTKGLFYPRALMQLMMGLYVAEICLIGLFALKSALGPLLLMAVFFVFTALVHISLHDAVTPLLYNLPRTLALEKDNGPIADDETPGAESHGPAAQHETSGGLAADYYNVDDEDSDADEPPPPPADDLDADIQLRGIEGSSSIRHAITAWTKSALKTNLGKLRASAILTIKTTTATTPTAATTIISPTPAAQTPSDSDSPLTLILARIKKTILTPSESPSGGAALLTFLHPDIYQSFRTLAPRINPEPPPPPPADDSYTRRRVASAYAYQPPEVWAPPPRLWLPRDEARVSRQEVAHTREAAAAAGGGGVFVSDRGCWLTVSGGSGGRRGGWGRVRTGVECDFEGAPEDLWGERVVY